MGTVLPSYLTWVTVHNSGLFFKTGQISRGAGEAQWALNVKEGSRKAEDSKGERKEPAGMSFERNSVGSLKNGGKALGN